MQPVTVPLGGVYPECGKNWISLPGTVLIMSVLSLTTVGVHQVP